MYATKNDLHILSLCDFAPAIIRFGGELYACHDEWLVMTEQSEDALTALMTEGEIDGWSVNGATRVNAAREWERRFLAGELTCLDESAVVSATALACSIIEADALCVTSIAA